MCEAVMPSSPPIASRTQQTRGRMHSAHSYNVRTIRVRNDGRSHGTPSGPTLLHWDGWLVSHTATSDGCHHSHTVNSTNCFHGHTVNGTDCTTVTQCSLQSIPAVTQWTNDSHITNIDQNWLVTGKNLDYRDSHPKINANGWTSYTINWLIS